MAILLKHQTTEAFVTRVRAAYREGNPEVLVKIAKFIIAKISSGDITDAQCRNAFGVNSTKWNTLKTKMQNLIDASNILESAIGE